MQTKPLSPASLGLTGRKELHLAGALPPAPRVAIVGSRAAQRHLRRAVPSLMQGVAAAGWSLVSGGAVGIDGDAHRAALAQAVPQLAVLPCGPDRLYPPHHRELFERLRAAPSCGLLFAHAAGTATTRGIFASRNAIVVGLAEAVLVVDAAPRSGTMRSATLARRRGRPRAALTGSAGAALMAAQGATMLRWDPATPGALVAACRGWLEAVCRGERPSAPAAIAWPEHLRWLRAALAEAGPGGVRPDALESPRAALFALIEAEAEGLVIERSPGCYVAAG